MTPARKLTYLLAFWSAVALGALLRAAFEGMPT